MYFENSLFKAYKKLQYKSKSSLETFQKICFLHKGPVFRLNISAYFFVGSCRWILRLAYCNLLFWRNYCNVTILASSPKKVNQWRKVNVRSSNLSGPTMENTRWSINGIIFRVWGSLEKETNSQMDFLVSSVVDPQLFQCGSGSSILWSMRIRIKGFDDQL
jgi:hypothetical protein